MKQVRAAFAALFLVLGGAAFAQTSKLAGEIDAKGLGRLVASQKGRVVLVNFWATWCVPCREEFPDLARLQRNLGPRGLQVFGISTDLSKEMPEVEKFIAIQRPEFPNYHKTSGG